MPALSAHVRPPVWFLLAAVVVSSCVDAPSSPDASTFAPPLVIAPSLALVGPSGAVAATQAQADALSEAFDLVDRFRMVVTRVTSGETVVDTTITVTPGQDEYDLSVSVNVLTSGERFSIVLTALQGTTELFTADPVTVAATTASEASSSTPPAATNVTMRYSGPGVEATSVQVSPATLVLGPGGSGIFAAEVQGDEGSVVNDVPLSWTVASPGVAEVSGGTTTAIAEGAVQVVVATPTGLEARAWAYVVGGELAFAADGVVKTRGTAGGDATERSSVGGAGQPAWSPDGNRLFYVAAGRVHLAGGEALLDGSWPSVSPDGSKLAVESGGSIVFANDDGTNPTDGPSGGTPVWADGANLLVSGGSVQQVRADGSGRTTVAGGSASLPARGPGGVVAYVADGQLFAVGRADAILDGAAGRPSWSVNGMWLVVGTGEGLTVVPADGRGPGAPLPGLGAASDPAFKPGGPLDPLASVTVTGLDPDPPTPGQNVTVLGTGFDWIIPGNNRVFWPTRDGAEEGVIRSVTESRIEVVMPRAVSEGQIRVETRASTGLLAFDPQLAAIDVLATTPFQVPVSGIEVVIRDAAGAEVLRDTTDDEGRALMAGLVPGTYTLEIIAPEGFRLEGEASHSFTLSTETVLLEVEVMPLVHTVTTVPEVLEVEVGSRAEVTLVPVDFRGQVMEQVSTARWLGGTPYLAATGEGLRGAIIGAAPVAGAQEGVLVVQLNGDVFELPATVTSYVEGTVVRDPDPPAPASAPATTESVTTTETSAVTVDTEPARGIEVKVLRGGVVVTTATTDGTGRYRAGGLFAGGYDVVIDPTPDRTPVPDLQPVVLDNGRPFATADFLMARAPVDHIALDAGAAKVDALDGTVTIAVTAFDVDNNPLGGRRVTYVSSNPATATVDANGTVTAVANGIVTVTVTVEGVSMPIDITVDQKAVVITILDDEDMKPMPDGIFAFVGEGGTLAWEAFDANEYEIKHKTPNFTTSSGLIASVDAAGIVAVLDVGFVDLTVEMDGVTDVLTLDARGVHVGDLIIMNSTDLLAVQAGVLGRVDGNLVVESTSLTNLTGLESLLEITGSVVVRLNSLLTDMAGLGGLIHVETDVVIEGNPLLVTPPLAQAAMLEAIDGSLRIIDNDAITDIDVFDNLEFIGGDLDFTGNDALARLDGLPLIDHLPGSLNLEANPSLTGPTILPHLTTVGGFLDIVGGGVVVRFPALMAVRSDIGIGVWMGADLILKEVGFPALTCAGGAVLVEGNAALETVTLPVLPIIGDDSCWPGPPPPTLVAASAPRVFGVGSRLSRSFRPDWSSSIGRRSPAADRAEVRRDRIEARTADFKESREARERRLDQEFERMKAQGRDRGATDPVARVLPAGRANGSRVARQLAHDSAWAESRRDIDQPRRDRTQRSSASRPQRVVSRCCYSLSVSENPLLSTLDLPWLHTVNGAITLNGASSLTALLLPALDAAVELNVRFSPIVTLSAPLLTDLWWDLDIASNAGLVSMDLPLLTDIGDDLDIDNNDALTTLFLPSLDWVSDVVDIDYNDALTSIRLPVMMGQDEDEEDFDIHDNASLLTISVAETTLFESGYDVEIYRNPMLLDISWPGMVLVYEDLDIWENASLESITIGTLAPFRADWDIYISNNPSLRTIDMPRLQRVWDDLDVWDNASLERLSAPEVTLIRGDLALYRNGSAAVPFVVDLPTLHTVASNGYDDLDIDGNPGLRTLSLPALLTVGDDAWIYENPNLSTVDLPLLQSTGGWFEVDGSPLLSSFTVPSLTTVGDWFEVDDNAGLTTFSAPVLTSIKWGLYIENNALLQDFDLGAVTAIGVSVNPSVFADILDNPALTDFDLSSLAQVGNVRLTNNDAMTTLPSLASLAPGASVHIDGNALLANLDGLVGRTSLGTLRVELNPALTDVSGLSTVQTASSIQIINNDALVNFSGMTALTGVKSDLQLYWNDALTTLSFPALSLIGEGPGATSGLGDFNIQANPALTAIAFPALVVIASDVTVSGNTALTNLGGLSALTSSVWDVSIIGNTALTDVTGLSSLGDAGTPPAARSFTIQGNIALTNALATALAATIETNNPLPADDLPTVVISGNEP